MFQTAANTSFYLCTFSETNYFLELFFSSVCKNTNSTNVFLILFFFFVDQTWTKFWTNPIFFTLSCVSAPYFKACFSSPAGLNSYIMPAVCTSWAFDSDRFQLAVDCIILDFSLCTSLHLGWPCFQHVHYWLTHCLTKFYRPGFDWKTPKISRHIKMATESLLELWTFAANCLDFLCMSFGRLKQAL